MRVPGPRFGRLRERLYHRYRIIYRLRGEDVEVVSICHGAKLLPETPPDVEDEADRAEH